MGASQDCRHDRLAGRFCSDRASVATVLGPCFCDVLRRTVPSGRTSEKRIPWHSSDLSARSTFAPLNCVVHKSACRRNSRSYSVPGGAPWLSRGPRPADPTGCRQAVGAGRNGPTIQAKLIALAGTIPAAMTVPAGMTVPARAARPIGMIVWARAVTAAGMTVVPRTTIPVRAIVPPSRAGPAATAAASAGGAAPAATPVPVAAGRSGSGSRSSLDAFNDDTDQDLPPWAGLAIYPAGPGRKERRPPAAEQAEPARQAADAADGSGAGPRPPGPGDPGAVFMPWAGWRSS